MNMNKKNQTKSFGKTFRFTPKTDLETQNLWWNIWADTHI